MLPSALTLGENTDVPLLIAGGSSTGVPHRPRAKSTRQRCPPPSGNVLWSKLPSRGFVVPSSGRLDAKTRNDPSGDMVGSKSRQCPENGATVGADQRPLAKVDVTIIVAVPLLRVNTTVFPSGAKAGDRSSAGPEITPGANSCGLFEAWARHDPPWAA